MILGKAVRVGLLLFGPLALCGQALADVTGFDVNRVLYTHARGSGEFYVDGPGAWVERNPDGTFRFEERSRDENSVWLYDAPRDTWIVLNIVGKNILLRQGSESGSYVPIYKIDATEGSAPVASTQRPAAPAPQQDLTWNVVGVTANHRRFSQNADGTWLYWDSGAEATFFEEYRNGTYIQLHPVIADGTWSYRLNLQSRKIETPNPYRDDGAYMDFLNINDVQTGQAVSGQPRSLPAAPGNTAQAPGIYVELYNPYSVSLNVYIDDPARGVYYAATLPPATTSALNFARGTRLVFGEEGGAAIGVYDVLQPLAYVVDISTVGGIGAPAQPAVASPAPPANYPQPPRDVPAVQQPASALPAVQTTPASLSSDGVTNATLIAGIGTVDELSPTSRAMQFRTQKITLQQQIDDNGVYRPVTLELNPQIYAWYENGSTYIRVDTQGSQLRVENATRSATEQGLFIEAIRIGMVRPQSWELTEYFPENYMDSTQVSSSRSLTIGASAGPNAYSTGVNASLTTGYSQSGNVPDFKSETSRTGRETTTEWKLCGVRGQDDRGGRDCVYNEPVDLGYKKDRRWISSLSDVPATAWNFSTLRQSFVLQKPGVMSSTEDIHISFAVDLLGVSLEKLTHEILKPGAEIGTALVCIIPDSAECRAMEKGVGVYNIRSRRASVTFNTRLVVGLAPLASVVVASGL